MRWALPASPASIAVRIHKNDISFCEKALDFFAATCGMAIDIGAKCIVVSSLSGRTVRMVSRFRVPMDIIGMATNKRVWYKLALSWGVIPVLSEQFKSIDVLFYHAQRVAQQTLQLREGDKVVMTGGITDGTSGNTNLIKVETI